MWRLVALQEQHEHSGGKRGFALDLLRLRALYLGLVHYTCTLYSTYSRICGGTVKLYHARNASLVYITIDVETPWILNNNNNTRTRLGMIGSILSEGNLVFQLVDLIVCLFLRTLKFSLSRTRYFYLDPLVIDIYNVRDLPYQAWAPHRTKFSLKVLVQCCIGICTMFSVPIANKVSND